ncbi:MAG: FadR/GntR family transcriptional regulator [Nocardioidaceae bacterium]
MTVRFYGGATAAVFAPLEPLSRVELVARRLTDAIALGLLPNGVQLPGEADLARAFGVSTVTVREALTSLRHRDLIETRRGRGGGSFVRAPEDVAEAIVRERLLALGLNQLRDLGDHYAAIAGTAARLAADRAADDDIVRLRRVARTLAKAASPGDRRRADARFHIEVAATAQSPRLYREEVALQAEVGTLLWLAFGDDDSHRRTVDHCVRIVDAIEAGDGPAARSAAELRMADATERLFELRLELVEG